MASSLDHECMTKPADENVKIWRYMDFTKFVSMLETGTLFLSRADKFEDPYEGAVSDVTIKQREEFYKSLPSDLEQILRRTTADRGRMRQWININCWHMNEFESAAMWKLYAKTDEAVAIQSTYKRLHECLPPYTYLSVVNYIDYSKHFIPDGNAFWPFVHKRLSFEHEKELRILQLADPHEIEAYTLENPKFGAAVKVELNDLIEKIHISPTAPSWFSNLVKDIVARYGLNLQVTQSDMAKAPVY